MTPLGALIRRRIAEEGPMRLDVYMALCLGHPEHGYYMTRDPFGAAGDFVTAPEVSQMFGELVGAWAAQVWDDQGRPEPFVLAELGPGRGTLMRDALRAAAAVPGFRDAARLWLVETSPALRARQAETLAARMPGWAGSVGALPDGPAIVVANEFFDALPIRQFQRLDPLWRERLVGVEGDGWLRLGRDATRRRARRAVPAACRRRGRRGQPGRRGGGGALGARIAREGGAALIIDYGGGGDRRHAAGAERARAGDPLAAPGEADLTAHVRFRALAEAARPARAHGPVAQGVFLERLGITARARALARAGRGRSRGDRRGPSPLDPPGGNGKPPAGSGADAGRCSAAPGIWSMTLEILTSELLAGVRHGFFTRRGGASSGIYAGLNCGPGSPDQREAVAVNRGRVAAALEVSPERLLSLHQLHSTTVVVAGPEGWNERPRADAAVTDGRASRSAS